jgi:hypothetical protein
MVQFGETFHDLGQILENAERIERLRCQILHKTERLSFLKDKDILSDGACLNCDGIDKETLHGIQQKVRLANLLDVTSFRSVFCLHLFEHDCVGFHRFTVDQPESVDSDR